MSNGEGRQDGRALAARVVGHDVSHLQTMNQKHFIALTVTAFIGLMCVLLVAVKSLAARWQSHRFNDPSGHERARKTVGPKRNRGD